MIKKRKGILTVINLLRQTIAPPIRQCPVNNGYRIHYRIAHGDVSFPNSGTKQTPVSHLIDSTIKGISETHPKRDARKGGADFRPSNGQILIRLRLQPVYIRVRHTVDRTNECAACKESCLFSYENEKVTELGSPARRSISSHLQEVNKGSGSRQPDTQTFCSLLL